MVRNTGSTPLSRPRQSGADRQLHWQGVARQFPAIDWFRTRWWQRSLCILMVRYTAFMAIGIKNLTSMHTIPDLEQAINRVDPGADQLGIARTGLFAHKQVFLNYQSLLPGKGHGHTDNASPLQNHRRLRAAASIAILGRLTKRLNFAHCFSLSGNATQSLLDFGVFQLFYSPQS